MLFIGYNIILDQRSKETACEEKSQVSSAVNPCSATIKRHHIYVCNMLFFGNCQCPLVTYYNLAVI